MAWSYGMERFARDALKHCDEWQNCPPIDWEKIKLKVDIKEFTEPKHVARKTKETCQGFCEWNKK